MPSLKKHARFLTPLAISILLACLALFLFERLADEMLEGDTLQFDSAVRNLIHGFSSPSLTAVMRAFTTVGNMGAVIAISATVCAVLWFRRRMEDALFLLLAISGGVFLMWVLKLLFHRQRPAPYFGITVPSDYSFPSGHALVAVCFYGMLAQILVTHRPGASRSAIWTVAALMALGVGLSRIYLGVHYPSDVLAGYLAATVWVVGVRAAYLHREKALDSR